MSESVIQALRDSTTRQHYETALRLHYDCTTTNFPDGDFLAIPNMIELQIQNEDNWEAEARTKAIEVSKANPGKYVTVYTCFGVFVDVAKRLCVFAPTDSRFDWYVLNGKVKPFTAKQKIADQNATPMMR